MSEKTLNSESKIKKIIEDVENDKERELTEEEKRELFIKELKESKKTYFPKKHFGVEYRKKKKRKNALTKQSRKNNRKK